MTTQLIQNLLPLSCDHRSFRFTMGKSGPEINVYSVGTVVGLFARGSGPFIPSILFFGGKHILFLMV
jgi:hypothetical protein